VTDLVIVGERIVFPDGERPGTIVVRAGRVEAIAAFGARPADVEFIDAGTRPVLPGLVDTHVHVNDPGRAHWEGFESATRAAAAGGITTVVDMPLNSIPATTSVAALDAKRRAAEGRVHVDVGFWGGVVPGNAAEIEPLASAGVLGFKCFLSPSGVDEFGHVDATDLRAAMPHLARSGLPLLVHAESPAALVQPAGDPTNYSTWLLSRPPQAERDAIDLMLRLAREFDARIHIVHLADAGALDAIRRARAEGVNVSVETCPHYLVFAAEEIARGATTFKCAPPIRERSHRDALWRGLMHGHIDLVASDHSPAPPDLKQVESGDFLKAWGGIASLQVSLAAVWTAGAPRGAGIGDIAQWMAAAPARLAGLSARKGRIAVGNDADFTIWDPDAEWIAGNPPLHHRHALTPYHGAAMRGLVRTTILRGQVIFHEGRFETRAGGHLIRGHRAG
jgi:allantoinase